MRHSKSSRGTSWVRRSSSSFVGSRVPASTAAPISSHNPSIAAGVNTTSTGASLRPANSWVTPRGIDANAMATCHTARSCDSGNVSL